MRIEPKVISYDMYNKISKELAVSEDLKAQEVPQELQTHTESISKTMIKKIRALTKDQLVKKLVDVHNYAEAQKAANMLLMYQVKQLNEKLNGKPQEVVADEATTNKDVTNENA